MRKLDSSIQEVWREKLKEFEETLEVDFGGVYLVLSELVNQIGELKERVESLEEQDKDEHVVISDFERY